MSNGTDLVEGGSRITALIDDVTIFVTTIGGKGTGSVLHHLISQSVVPTLVRQKRFTPDVAHDAVRLSKDFRDNILNPDGAVRKRVHDAKRAFSEKVELAPVGKDTFIFRVDVPRGTLPYRSIRTEVLPVEDFIAYYTDTSKRIQTWSHREMMEEIERSGRGDPIAFAVARHLRVVREDEAWKEQTSTMEGLIDAAYRLYCLTASHLLRERQVSLYGLPAGADENYRSDRNRTKVRIIDRKEDPDRLAQLDRLYHGFTRTMSASAAEISSYFIGVPFNDVTRLDGTVSVRAHLFLPLGFSLLHFIRTRGRLDFNEVDRKLTESIVTHAVWDKNDMSEKLLQAFEDYLKITPIGEEIPISPKSETEMKKMETVWAKNLIVRRLIGSLRGFSDTMEKDETKEVRSDAFEKLVVEMQTYVTGCEKRRVLFKVVDTRAAAWGDQLRKLGKTPAKITARQGGGVEWEATAALADVHMTEGDEEEERFVSVLWHIGEHGREDAWASCSGSESILQDAAEIWSKGGIVVET